MAYAPVVEGYDWPLLAVSLLVALSITLTLRAIRMILGLLPTVWRLVRFQSRRSRPQPPASVFRY